jgi:hypothetical protein
VGTVVELVERVGVPMPLTRAVYARKTPRRTQGERVLAKEGVAS